MDGVGLYVHLPFCESKCGYCDFYSVPAAGRDLGRAVRAIVRELGCRGGILDEGPATVFFGGGTPTVLPDAELQDVLTAVQRYFHPGRAEEFTVEANPASFDAARAGMLAAGGVDRISIGAQSFCDDELAVLERIHDSRDIAPSVRAARDAAITRLNLDLIFGIPGQTLGSWRYSLGRALELDPDHLACYGLTYEPGTPLADRRDRGQITPCDENLEAEMFLAGIETLTAAGYEHYEISNYAKPGQQCRHNVNCWRNRPYLGIGPSAASYLDGVRTRNVPDLDRYVQMIESNGHACLEGERLDGLAHAGECAMLALRTAPGIDVADFQGQTGFDPRVLFRAQIDRFGRLGLLTTVVDADEADAGNEYIRLTREGMLRANAVMAEFVSPDRPGASG